MEALSEARTFPSSDWGSIPGNRPPKKGGKKVTAILLCALLGLAFLVAVLVVLFRQKADEKSSESFMSLDKRWSTSEGPPITEVTQNILKNDGMDTTYSTPETVPDLEMILQNLLQSGKLEENFDFGDLTIDDIIFTTDFVRSRQNKGIMLSQNHVYPQVAKVAKAFYKSHRNTADLSGDGGILLPEVLVFDRPEVDEKTKAEMKNRLREFLDALRGFPKELEPDGDVWNYLGISLNEAPDDSKSKPPPEVIKKVYDIQRNFSPGFLIPKKPACSPGSVPCGLNNTECYSEDQKCDNKVDCSDMADELYCSVCHDFLKSTINGNMAICDGMLDCPDGDDEKNCGSCSPDEYQCGTDHSYNPLCVPISKRCDSIKDCQNGSDEIGCVSLWPASISPSGKLSGSPYTKGYLHWKLNDKWEIFSLPEENKDEFINSNGRSICSEILLNGEGDLPKDHKITYKFVYSSSSSPNSRSSEAHMVVNNIFIDEDPEVLIQPISPKRGAVHLILNCGNLECGRRRYSYGSSVGDISELLKSRIVGGSSSDPFDWPSMVGIFIDGDLLCGGTLIHPEWVLSAAHCFKNARPDETIVEAAAGMARLGSRSPYTQFRVVTDILYHSGFNRTYLINDIALLHLDSPIETNGKVSIACLNSNSAVPIPGNNCMTVGWGSTHETRQEVNNALQEVEVPIKDSCIQSYNNLTHQICGGFDLGGRDACQGDSGGPLYCSSSLDGDFSTHYLAGVVSHGIGCARPKTDGVYVRITYFRSWIDSVISITEEDEHKNKKKRSLTARTLVATIRNKYPDLPFENIRLKRDCDLKCDQNRCVHDSQKCDGVFQCMDRRDEFDCKFTENGKVYIPGYWNQISHLVTTTIPSTTTTKVTTTTSKIILEQSTTISNFDQNKTLYKKPPICGEEFFTCSHVHQCVSRSKICNFNKDCLDGSDEIGCSCIQYIPKDDKRICDGVPDCPDFEDERDCPTPCDTETEYYCSQSQECIPKEKVCNREYDCKYFEDERYCLAMIPEKKDSSIKLEFDHESRPIRHNSGYLSFNSEGVWNPICVDSSNWNEELNDKICKYNGHTRSDFFQWIPTSAVPDKSFLSTNSGPSFCDSGVIKSSCSSNLNCGVHPLYSDVDDFDKLNKMNQEGLFPWHVTLYQEGIYMCGASLIHRNWIMTSTECASKMSPTSSYVVARMGAHRDSRYLSPREQIRQVIQFTVVPHTGISLGVFRKASEYSRYVNPVCIPSSNWFPYNGKCVISGNDSASKILNRGLKLRVTHVCEINAIHDYFVCANHQEDDEICMRNWSGTLSCQDDTGRYYVLGVYHSKDGGCLSFDGTRIEKPIKFRSVSTSTARDAIKKIVGVFSANESLWYNQKDGCQTHRCPLGKCLAQNQICDGVPDCENATDEDPETCAGPNISMTPCTSLNSTHCFCESNQFACYRTGICVNKSKFCDGFDDCGDGTDEPEDCNQCSTALRVLNSEALCDGKIDCIDGLDSAGSDESSTSCCPEPDNFRCAIGSLKFGKFDGLEISSQCVSKESMCSHCPSDTLPNCSNGADDMDCMTIWPSSHNVTRNVFGKFKTQPQGYIHFISYGKKYLYCAGEKFYKALEANPKLEKEVADMLCFHEGYGRGRLTFHKTVEQHEVYSYSPRAEETEDCKLLYIVCEIDPLGIS